MCIRDRVCKVKEPIAEEYRLLGAKKDQTLFTYLHLAASRECTEALVAAGNVAIAYETVRQEDNSLPLLAPMSAVSYTHLPCRKDAPGSRKGSMRRSEAIMAPRGAYPEVRPLATVMMSGWYP